MFIYDLSITDGIYVLLFFYASRFLKNRNPVFVSREM